MIRQKAVTNDRHLLAILGLKNPELKEILANLDKFYSPYIKREKKKDGSIKRRVICPPKGKLKYIHYLINEKILNTHLLPDYIQGGVKGKDSIRNSKYHKGKNFHFCLDLKNFYPSVKNTRVNRVFLKLGYHPSVASTLTKLVTHSCKVKDIELNREVPQGAPTSTSISNLVMYKEVDIHIEKVIKDKGITYTRWIDDLNFSSQTDFIKEVYEIVQIISTANFKINRGKTFYKRGKVTITGVDVYQNALVPPRKLTDKLLEPNRSDKSKAGIQSHINRIKAT